MSSPPVHTGLWTNYKDGISVITLLDQDAFLLVSTLALLVALAGRAMFEILLWGCCHFILFDPEIRRILEKETSTFKLLPKLLYTLGKKPCLLRRKSLLGLTLVSCAFAFGIPVLSVLVSWAITGRTQEIPIVTATFTSGAGGLWILGQDASIFKYEQYNLNNTLAADRYFETCYQPQLASRCSSILNVQSIPRFITHNVSCPFNEITVSTE